MAITLLMDRNAGRVQYSPSMAHALDVLIDELCQQINSSDTALAWPDEVFLGWAERIARIQAESGSGIHRAVPSPVRRLDQLPAVTTDTFRFADVRAFPEDWVLEAEFFTSGTTARYRGRHVLYRTDIYWASALGGFDRLAVGSPRFGRLISLVPAWSGLPESSLAFMLSVFAEMRFEPRRVHQVVGPGGLDGQALGRALEAATEDRPDPVLLFTTTLAARALLDTSLGGTLPAGSLVLTTGGAKGLHGEVDPTAVERALGQRFPGARIGSEYGMTELLSQAYRIGPTPFRLPPWCRALAFEPAEGRRQPYGSPGLLRFVDLANVQSALTVQTADLGVTHSDHTFSYLGRAHGARTRGCSLTFEELTQVADVP